jgi:hypothetical protein
MSEPTTTLPPIVSTTLPPVPVTTTTTTTPLPTPVPTTPEPIVEPESSLPPWPPEGWDTAWAVPSAFRAVDSERLMNRVTAHLTASGIADAVASVTTDFAGQPVVLLLAPNAGAEELDAAMATFAGALTPQENVLRQRARRLAAYHQKGRLFVDDSATNPAPTNRESVIALCDLIATVRILVAELREELSE